jgi:hypothetical protein
MAYQSNPNDPYRRTDDEFRKPAALDNELQPDPELAEGPTSGSRVALFAIAIAVVLGAVFYGLNNTSTGTNSAQTTPANQNTAQTQTSTPPVAPGVRDVTPRNNMQPGATTGAAPARPQQPPASAPTGAELNRSGNPPTTDNTPAAK